MVISKEVDNKHFLYNENMLSGKKSLSVDGKEATKARKNMYTLSTGESVTVKGSFLSGVKLSMQGKEIVLLKNKWFEWILIFLPFLYLCIGLFGGAIGGGLSGLFAAIAAYSNAAVLRGKLNITVKILLCLLVTVVLYFVWFGIYIAITGSLAAAFPSIFGE